MSRSPTTPQPSNDSRRRELNPGDVGVGCILWLPLKDEANDSVYCTKETCPHEELNEGGYNHPVVVLSFRQRENSSRRGDLLCTVALMTTFTNTSLAKYKKKRSRDRRLGCSIPVYQPPADDEVGPVTPNPEYLHLESRRMKKQGFVRYDHTFEIPISYLRTYGYQRRSRACQYRLTQQSYTLLMTQSGLPAEPYVETDRLGETAGARIATLVRTQGQVANSAQSPTAQQTPVTPASHISIPLGGQPYYGTVRQPPTITVRPDYQQYRPPVYDDRYSRFGQEGNNSNGESGGWGGTILLCVGILAGVGYLLGWFSG